MSSERAWWEEFRQEMPVVENWAYFDHAAVAPFSRPAQKNIQHYATDLAENGAAHWGEWRKKVEETRTLGAKLLNAHADEIGIIRNTTEGIHLVAEGFDWKPGDNVVTLDCEFPSNLFPWQNLKSRGVETRLVETVDERVDLNRMADACDERTRIVSASWVGYATGWRNDLRALAEIAHRNNAFFFLDAIQGLGVFPLDVTQAPIDFLAADGHKWLLGPEGAGLFYVRREHLDRLRPLGVGWNSVVNAGDFSSPTFQLKNNVARYEGGSYNMAAVAGLAGSLNLLLSFGIEHISDRLVEFTDALSQRLETAGANIASCRDPERCSGIVAFELRGETPKKIQARCREQNVIVNCRAGRVRLSPHAYNNTDDVDRLFSVLFPNR